MRDLLPTVLLWVAAVFAAILALGFGEISLASGRYWHVIICSVVAALAAAAAAWAGCDPLPQVLRIVARSLFLLIAFLWIADQLSRFL